MNRENSYATLDADGQVPVGQLDNAPGSHPDLAAHNTLGLATQAELDAHATATHAATQAAAEATAAAALSGHAADTTAIHGIADTAALSLTSHDHDADYEAAGGIATHSADSTSVHGIADTAALSLTSHNHNAAYEAIGATATHEADTSVHGIADTTVLATDAEVATAVSDHAAAANPHPTYLTAAEGDAAYEVTGAVATHAGLADPHTGYRLESADHSHATTGLQAGTVAHTALTAVGIDDHHARDHAVNGSTHTGTLDDAQIPAGIARDAEVTSAVGAEATARDAAIATHAGLADPHAGYRLESADHSHASTGLQAGQVAHSALSGITANDHHAQTHAAAHIPTGADPVDKFVQNAIGTADLAIANTETVVVSKVFAASELTAGMTFMVKAYATRAGTTSASPVMRIRIGTTTLTGNIAATLTPPVNTLAVGNEIEGIVTIRSAGAGGTALGSLKHTVHLAAVTITEALGVSSATVAVDTTAANQRVELTFISGNAANTYTWRNAVMYRVA